MVGDLSKDLKYKPSRRMNADESQPFPRQPAFGLFPAGTDFSVNPRPITEIPVPKYQLVAPDEPKRPTAVGIFIIPDLTTPPTQETVWPRLDQGVLSRSFADRLADGPLKAPSNLSLSPSLNSGPLIAPSTILRRKPNSLFNRKKLPDEAAAPDLPVAAKETKTVAKKETKKRAVHTAEGATRQKKRKRGSAPAAAIISESEIEKRVVQGELPEHCKGVSACKGQSVKWRSQIWNGESVVYLDIYEKKRNAAIRYDLESIMLWGPKQKYLNFGLENYPDWAKMYEEAQQRKAKMQEGEKEEDKGDDVKLSPTTSKKRSAGRKKQGKGKYTGASSAIHSNKWCSNKGNVHRHIGFFTDPTQAATAYDNGRLEPLGPQAWTNSGKQLEIKDTDLFSSSSSPETQAAIATSRQQDGQATNGAMDLVNLS